MKKMETQEKKKWKLRSKCNMMSKNKPAAFNNLKFYNEKTGVQLLLRTFEEKKTVLVLR